MILVDSKKRKPENILKKYPDAVLADVTSTSPYEHLRQFSPFYPHGGIPVPNSPGVTATCVEAIWQGLKVFETCDIDTSLFRNDTMQHLKRTVRKYGRPLGHRYGVGSPVLLGYVEARHKIYLPAYRWVLENRLGDLVQRLREASQDKTVILLDYNTNADVDNPAKPLSHASLIKAYVEGVYPFAEKKDAATMQTTLF